MSAPTMFEHTLISISLGQDGEEMGRGQVLAERTRNPHLAVNPMVDHEGGYTGRFALTHVPTGRAVTVSEEPHRLRAIAEGLADLDWDHQGVEELTTAGTLAAASLILNRIGAHEPSGVEVPHADNWGGKDAGIPRQTVPFITWNVEVVQEALRRTMGIGEDAVPLTEPGSVTAEKPHGVANPVWTLWLSRQIESFGVVYLLLVLHRVAPRTAESAVAWLADQWETGESIGEFTADWWQHIQAGTLDDLDIPALSPPLGNLFTA